MPLDAPQQVENLFIVKILIRGFVKGISVRAAVDLISCRNDLPDFLYLLL